MDKRNIKKVCIVTAARSEYGLLRWVIDGVHNSTALNLQLVVTGSHLSEEHGYTVKDIVEDGYPIAARVDMYLQTNTKEQIVKSMGVCMQGFAETFAELNPDLVIVLGDRYELLPICSAALVMNIPIAHISGGDITIGAIDNEVRNAITMMADIHFPGIEESANNIIRMRNSDKYVWTVGEPGLDNFERLSLMSRKELAENIGIPYNNRWILVTVHSETQQDIDYNIALAENVYKLTESIDGVSVVISKANADFGGSQINDFWERISNANSQKYHLYPSLGQRRYLSFMKECFAVVGNSSSGIVEAPCLGTPVINIGDRQQGRHLCKNVIQVDNDIRQIQEAWIAITKSQEKIIDNYYGDGHTADKIIDLLEKYFYE